MPLPVSPRDIMSGYEHNLRNFEAGGGGEHQMHYDQGVNPRTDTDAYGFAAQMQAQNAHPYPYTSYEFQQAPAPAYTDATQMQTQKIHPYSYTSYESQQALAPAYADATRIQAQNIHPYVNSRTSSSTIPHTSYESQYAPVPIYTDATRIQAQYQASAPVYTDATRIQAQNVHSYSNGFYGNTTQSDISAYDNSFLATNYHTREQYSSQMNGAWNTMIPEERPFCPRGGMYLTQDHAVYGSVNILERNVTVSTVAYPTPSYYPFAGPADIPVTQISGNALDTAVTPAPPALQPGPLYETVEDGFRCIDCGTVTKREYDMHRHLTTTVRHGGKRLGCSTCGVFYTRRTTLRDHVCAGP